MSFEAFFWSIAQQESGGRYSAVGPPTPYGRAYGKYQVLAPNVGPWTAQYYGRRLTPQQFLANPAAQEAVARGKLKSYYNKYGARGAAAMWYSGQSNPNKTYGNPPVYRYVSSVVGRMNNYRGGGGGGGGMGAIATPIMPKLSDKVLASQYGLSSSLINSSKTLKSLFKKAVAQGWTPARFTAELKNSKWWRTQSKTLREYIIMKHSDPATFSQKWKQYQYAVNQLAVQAGLGNQINKKGQSSELLKDAIYNRFALGWSDARVGDWLAARAKTHDGVMWGEAGEAFNKLHSLAYAMGMTYSGSWYADRSREIASGKTTIETMESKIRAQAGAKYYAFKNQIMAGQSVQDLAAPYVSTVARILELPETDIDVINNKHVIKAMTSKVKAGQQPATQYPIWQFENDLRNDPLWRKTNNARESLMTTARQVAKDFGMAT